MVYSNERDCSLNIIPDSVLGKQGVGQFGWSLLEDALEGDNGWSLFNLRLG